MTNDWLTSAWERILFDVLHDTDGRVDSHFLDILFSQKWLLVNTACFYVAAQISVFRWITKSLLSIKFANRVSKWCHICLIIMWQGSRQVLNPTADWTCYLVIDNIWGYIGSLYKCHENTTMLSIPALRHAMTMVVLYILFAILFNLFIFSFRWVCVAFVMQICQLHGSSTLSEIILTSCGPFY